MCGPATFEHHASQHLQHPLHLVPPPSRLYTPPTQLLTRIGHRASQRQQGNVQRTCAQQGLHHGRWRHSSGSACRLSWTIAWRIKPTRTTCSPPSHFVGRDQARGDGFGSIIQFVNAPVKVAAAAAGTGEQGSSNSSKLVGGRLLHRQCAKSGTQRPSALPTRPLPPPSLVNGAGGHGYSTAGPSHKPHCI